MTLFAHVDADCFYVSCERIRAPYLANRPVAVLGNQGACVIARSYEMKPFGVDVAMPIWQAKRLCPEGIYIKRDFRWYGLLSQAMQDVFQRYSDVVEHYSVDESFLDLEGFAGSWEPLAKDIQSTVLRETGLPVSVGFARTRTLCKLASKMNKPLGIGLIDKGELRQVLREVNLEQVNGIGRRLIRRCHKLGLYSAADFVDAGRQFVKTHFNKPGEILWYELQGHPIHPIKPIRQQLKIVSRGGSIWGHYTNSEYIWGFLVRNLERFLTELWDKEIEIYTLTVVLRRSNGESDVATIPLDDYTQDQGLLLAALRKGFKKAFKAGERYCRVHIVGKPIRSAQKKQLSFLSTEKDETRRERAIKKLKQSINSRFGLFTLREASTAYASEVFKDKASDFEITDIPGKHLF